MSLGCVGGEVRDAATGNFLGGVLVTLARGVCFGSGCGNPTTTTTSGALAEGQFVFDEYGDTNGPGNVQQIRGAFGEPTIELIFSRLGYDTLSVAQTLIYEPPLHGRTGSRIPNVYMCPVGSPDLDGDRICDAAEARYEAAEGSIPGIPREFQFLRRADLVVSFDQLASFHSGCSGFVPADPACRAASGRLCASLGFVSGVGPVEALPNSARVICVGGPDAVRHETNFESLAPFDAACTSPISTSDACARAISRFCMAQGSQAGGFGPVEQSGNQIGVICVGGASARQVAVPFSEVNGEVSGCPSSGYNSIVCRVASSRVCERLGYLSGFGPTGQSSTHLAQGCIEKPRTAVGRDLRFEAASPLTLSWANVPKRTLNPNPAGLNAVRYSPVPGRPGYFFGRVDAVKVTVTRREGDAFVFVADVVTADMRFVTGNVEHTIRSAYDPSSFFFNGETWLAFECTGTISGSNAFGAFGRAPATCMGPVNTTTWALDLGRTTVVIQGEDITGQNLLSASVPVVFTHQDRPYLYWTAARFNFSRNVWFDLVSRGIELQQESTGRRRLLAKGHTLDIPSNHPDTTLVWDLGPPPRLNQVANVEDVHSDGRYVYATAALGGFDPTHPVPSIVGSGCLTPSDHTEGCYRMVVARTLKPLGHRVFNEAPINDTLPDVTHEYATFITNPSGGLSILGQFVKLTGGSSAVLPGLQELDLALPASASALGPICDALLQPAPDWGVKNNACLPSCSGVGGTAALSVSCASAGLRSAGAAYDTEYCCR